MLKRCRKDIHSNRYQKGFFGVFFGKGNKTNLEGKKMNQQRGLSSDHYSEVPSTKAAKETTPINVNSSNAKRKQKEVERNYWKNSLKGSRR